MKKSLTVLFAISFSLLTFAQSWTVNPAEFEFSMNITGQAHILGEIANEQDSYVGAFVNDICVGVCQPVEIDGIYKFFYLTVYSNQYSGEVIEFRFEDSDDNITLFVNNVVFQSDRIVGSADNPFIWMEEELYHSAEIFEFSFVEQVSPAVISSENKTVSVMVENGTDLTSLVPEFTLAPGATATVSLIEQESGVTENDFTSDVIYVVTGADETTTSWTVRVAVDNSAVLQFNSDKISIYPNPTNEYLNIDFSNLKTEKILIYNINGKVLIEETNIAQRPKIDVSQINAGLYFISVYSEYGIYKLKFVKE